jgi:hypothetical protein
VTGIVSTGTEPWSCTLPSIGTVLVSSDGSSSVALAERVDAAAEQMLREQVAGPLSWWRRGYWLLNGAVVVSPGGQAVLMCGQPDLTERLVVAMSQRGWTCVGDSLVPASMDEGALVAHPRSGTVICSSTLSAAESLEAVAHPRPGGNAVMIRIPMHEGPVALAATALFPLAPMPSESAGLARARSARAMLVEVSRGERTPQQLLDVVSCLAALPQWVTSDPAQEELADDQTATASSADRAAGIRARICVALDDLTGWLDDLPA